MTDHPQSTPTPRRYEAALPCFVRNPGAQHWPMTSMSMAQEAIARREADIERLRATLRLIIEVWERDDETGMRHRGDEMTDMAKEALGA